MQRIPTPARSFRLISAAIGGQGGGIGIKGRLPWKSFQEDMAYFKQRTEGCAVVMGRKTYESLPKREPLANRLNIVVTRSSRPRPTSTKSGIIFASSLNDALAKIAEYNHRLEKPRTYVIGGQALYTEAIQSPQCEAVELTNVSPRLFGTSEKCDTFFPRIPDYFNLSKTQILCDGATVETWENPRDNSPFNPERTYLSVLRHVIEQGEHIEDRTGVGTIQEFGVSLCFPLNDPDGRIPVLTSKKVAWKSVAEEILQFSRGDINANHLREKGVPIWNAHTSRKHLDAIGGNMVEEGSMWKAYGFQWRQLGMPYLGIKEDYRAVRNICLQYPPGEERAIALQSVLSPGVSSLLKTQLINCTVHDQLRSVIDTIRDNPTSRRIILNAWHVPDLNQMCLPPCHMVYVFNVSRGRLNCQLLQRSWDLFLGAPFNIAGTALLVRLICHTIEGLEPGEIKIDAVNAHIYQNHIDQVTRQLERAEDKGLFRFPRLEITRRLNDLDDWDHLTSNDLILYDYNHHPGIKAPIAV